MLREGEGPVWPGFPVVLPEAGPELREGRRAESCCSGIPVRQLNQDG